MSTPGNTAKIGTVHSNIQTAESSPELVGSEPTMHKGAIPPKPCAAQFVVDYLCRTSPVRGGTVHVQKVKHSFPPVMQFVQWRDKKRLCCLLQPLL